MKIRALVMKSAFLVAVATANLVIFPISNAEARGPGYQRSFSPPPLASAKTTVRPHNVVSGCSIGRRCATTNANGGVVVTTRGGQSGPRFPRR